VDVLPFATTNTYVLVPETLAHNLLGGYLILDTRFMFKGESFTQLSDSVLGSWPEPVQVVT
jgi:hypothetical protein